MKKLKMKLVFSMLLATCFFLSSFPVYANNNQNVRDRTYIYDFLRENGINLEDVIFAKPGEEINLSIANDPLSRTDILFGHVNVALGVNFINRWLGEVTVRSTNIRTSVNVDLDVRVIQSNGVPFADSRNFILGPFFQSSTQSFGTSTWHLQTLIITVHLSAPGVPSSTRHVIRENPHV